LWQIAQGSLCFVEARRGAAIAYLPAIIEEIFQSWRALLPLQQIAPLYPF
jgi:hypothetical protein